ncbi:MAG: trypsin-like serine protease [Ruminococcaceae bacterium]|nr:trypsin-like serine protease [Oscillospiraceae bacterium]
MKKVLSFLLTVLLAGGVSFFVSVVMLDRATPMEENGLTLTAEADDPAMSDVAARVTPSVVGVSSVNRAQSFSAPSSTQSMGSGVIVSKDGYILTNHHVIGEKTDIYVTLSDGRTVRGRKIWSDAALDIAIIKIEEAGLTPAVLGNSSTLAAGEPVLAIGNPLSLQFQRTVTAGIISATGRILYMSDNNTLMEDLIQTDASINPGNSGGPLVNMLGEVVGINTVKAQDAEGMGFAIAINLCRPIVERAAREGSYEMPYLGLYAHDKETARYMQEEAPETGLYVSEVAGGSPARVAGLTKGDIILAANGQPLTRMAQLREVLLYCRVGDTIHLDINRDGTLFTATATLKAEP